jgi:hypothetical protein
MGKREINAKELVGDIRAGTNDFGLMEKYKLTPKGLDSTFRKLLAVGLISSNELAVRKTGHEETVDLDLEAAFAEKASSSRLKKSYSFSGRVENVDLLDYLQWMLMDLRQTVLEVRSPSQRTFRIFVNAGRVTHATNGNLEGEDAFYQCIQLSNGEFLHLAWMDPEETTIKRDGTALLFEAARRRDEAE